MGPIQAVKTCMRKYVTFSGRASRSEFWWFVLFVMIVPVIPSYFAYGMDGIGPTRKIGLVPSLGTGETITELLIFLVTFLPLISVMVRRLHDTGRSGYWLLGYYLAVVAVLAVFFISYRSSESSFNIAIGVLVFLFAMQVYFLLDKSEPGRNVYSQDADVGIFE